jgi:hypothetical protein
MNRKLKLAIIGLVVLSTVCVLLVGYRLNTIEQVARAAALEKGVVSDTSASASVPSNTARTTPAKAFYLEYRLDNGYIHNWLVAGPQAIPIVDLERFAGKNAQFQVAGHHYERDSGITQLPAENESFTLADTELTWHYYKTLDDHFVDLSAPYPGPHYLRAWAYAQVTSPSSQRVTLILTTHGPADLWLNGEHIHRQERFCHPDPQSVSFQARLERGHNEILVRFEQVAARESPYAMALQIVGPASPGGIPVLLPTHVENVARRQMFERLFEQVHLEREVDHRGNNILLRWAEDLDTQSAYTLQVQDARNRIYVGGLPEARPSATVNAGHPARLWEGDYRVVLKPPLEEYYGRNVRYQRDIPIRVVDNAYSESPYGTYDERRQEALEDAARRENNLFSEIAQLELGRWPQVSPDLFIEAIEQIDQRQGDSEAYMVGLLGTMHRYADDPRFPQALKRRLDEFVLTSNYWLDKAGNAESHSILFYTSQILAGQRYLGRAFAHAGQTGRRLQRTGEQQALSWLKTRATVGFTEWDSNSSFEAILVALSHLADLAENEAIRERATAVMDKLFLTMALNSYKGVFGSTHGRTRALMVKSGRLEATSGISRLMWGMGVYNRHIMGAVSLASSAYELPPVIADIAADLPEEMWNRERHTRAERGWLAWFARRSEVNKVTYKTPDYMLSSAQDYRSGKRGKGEHIWQATMGPDAVVFVTHPPNMSDKDSQSPSFWLGNAVLPRVAQWKDTLIAVHKLPEDDWMGFTHAYFPIYAFDEYTIQGNWAFARKGDGYLALTAAQGIELVRRGPGAYRELRSYGKNNVWLCLMGRVTTDGSFEEYQRVVLALEVDFGDLVVRLDTLRGETLSFGWKGPLWVNDKIQLPHKLPKTL